MAIRPLDMQVMVPRLQEVSRMRQLENQRPNIDQGNIAQSSQKEIKHQNSSVAQSNEDQEMDNQPDAKEEGQNAYGYQKPKERKLKNDRSRKKAPLPKSYHKIDVQV